MEARGNMCSSLRQTGVQAEVEVEGPQVSVRRRRINKMRLIHTMELFLLKKEGNSDTRYSMDGP